MKMVTLLGSPRTKGNTATVLEALEARLPGPHTIERINLADFDLHGCLGCNACQRQLTIPGCPQKDDLAFIIEQMLAADVLVYATPLYVWDFSAQLKTLLDRQYCLTKWQGSGVAHSLLAGKKALLLVTCGGGVDGNADLVQVLFDRIMACAGCRVVGKHIVPDCTTPPALDSRLEGIVQNVLLGLGLSAALTAAIARLADNRR